jgi:hypothetical protein
MARLADKAMRGEDDGARRRGPIRRFGGGITADSAVEIVDIDLPELGRLPESLPRSAQR